MQKSDKLTRGRSRISSTVGLCLRCVLLLLLLQGCKATKFLNEGESFYKGSEIEFKPQGEINGLGRLEEDLQALLPKPNPTLIGMRPNIWFYYVGGEKGIRKFLRNKLGSPPILLKDVAPGRLAEMLEGELHNKGFFHATVKSSVETDKKESTVIYSVDLPQPFRLRKINNHLFDSLSYPKIAQGIWNESLLRPKQRYSVERMRAEQERIEEVLENQGFYYFDDRYLIYEADTTVGKRQIDLDLEFEEGMPEKATRKYWLDEITVYPSYELTNDSLQSTSDTLRLDGFTIIDNHHDFRPGVLTRSINLKSDSVYRRQHQEYTLSHLMGLKTFKFVNIKFTPDEKDSAKLDAAIYLTPLLKKSLRLQLQAVSKSNNFVGPGLELSFTNRNLFRGAELFQLKFTSAYEVQISNQQSTPVNAIEFGAESTLAVPRFITPFEIKHYTMRFLPQTQFKLGYSYQQRVNYFKLTSLTAGYGYIWRETALKTHELRPIDVSYIRSTERSADFEELLEKNPTLKNSFQDQFILGMRYSFTMNTQMEEDVEQKFFLKRIRTSNFYFNGTVDLSGNILHALQALDQEKEHPYLLFNSPYSQYLRGDVDFRYYLQLNRHTKIASRISTGLGYAYGNSTNLPYIKQFSIGGSNSLRAFPARSVGPGTYDVRTDPNHPDDNFFIDQRADIKLEGNVEYRFDIIKMLKGAVFVDAGNIWLRTQDTTRVGGEFHGSTFLNQLAVGTGAGLRFDFSFFVLRFDLAFPIRKPKEKWVIDEIDFSNRQWRRDNLILNIAIGYPF